MNNQIVIIDYGLGNLHSVEKVFRHLGCDVIITEDGKTIAEAERLILPGVGAFADGMRGLQERGLDVVLRNFAASGRPLLGICLGAQLILQVSDEFGTHAGLGLIQGRVERIPCTDVPVPHVGWAQLEAPEGRQALSGILGVIPTGSWMYFIHSFHMVPADRTQLTAVCRYGDHVINAALQQGAVSALQFHPEKSGREGLKILSAFAGLDTKPTPIHEKNKIP